MQEMIFEPVDSHNLRWKDMPETFWLALVACFDEYRSEARSDVDKMSAHILAENVFYEGNVYEDRWYLNPISAMAIRRMYFFYRLRSKQYDAFAYQFQQMIIDVETFLKAFHEGDIVLTPFVPEY